MNDFKYEELEAATKNFSTSTLIGKGSHGCVYKGVLKEGKLVVAIKKQSLGLQKLQDNSKLENEARILSSILQNQFLINLFGTSHDSAKNKVLVMEHMPNGTLYDLLHSAPTPPSWPKRLEIAVQIARAVQFLHETAPLIIHRDIKSANILFDSAWNAKLADFGLAVRMTDNSLSHRVDSVSQPAGTIGYLDPSYTSPSKLSTKNDVFSFGVVLLEIISCTKVIDVCRVPISLVERATSLIKERRMLEICDNRTVMPQYMVGIVKKILNIAKRCVSLTQNNRPTMREVTVDLENLGIERVRFPIWTNFLQRIILLKRRRKICCKRCKNTTTTILCAAQEAKVHVDISSRVVGEGNIG